MRLWNQICVEIAKSYAKLCLLFHFLHLCDFSCNMYILSLFYLQ